MLENLSKCLNFSQEELAWVAEFLKQNEKAELTQEDITSEWIREFILNGGEHPAKKYPDLFSPLPPHAGVTYQWTLGLGSGEGLLSHVKDVSPELRIWLDIIFIDQLSNEVAMNLAKAQEVYALLPLHLVFPQSVESEKTVVYPKREPKVLKPSLLLDRGWCIFELCLRAIAEKKSFILGDQRALGSRDGYDYVGNMHLSMDKDRDAIEAALWMIFGVEIIGGKLVAKRQAVNSTLAKQIVGSSIEEAVFQINSYMLAAQAQAGPTKSPAQQHPPPVGPPQQPTYGQAVPYALQQLQPTHGQPLPAPFGQPAAPAPFSGHATQEPRASAYGAAPQQPSYGNAPSRQPQAPTYDGYSAPAPAASAYPQYGGAPAPALAPYASPSAQASYAGVPPAAPGPSTAGLPPGWQEHRDAKGRFYYHNATTHATQWNRPGADSSVAAGWREHKDVSGRSYYVNEGTGHTQWEQPATAPHASAAAHGAPPYGAAAPFGAQASNLSGLYGALSPPAATPALAGPPAAPLPPGWAEHRDPAGRPYYYNTSTHACQWHRP